jgi:stringent starvation protein B
VISSKSYLLRAYYDWITDNHWTPYVLVDATFSGVIVPQNFVKDGKVILDVSFNAIRSLEINQSAVSFSALFDGYENIHLPIISIKAIYAAENGQGIEFPVEDPPSPDQIKSDSDDEKGSKNKKGPPHLRVVD